MSPKTLLGSALAAALTMSATAASAAESDATHEERATMVSYADLDLSTASGEKTLKGRIRFAARKVCQVSGMGPVKDSMYTRACMNKALENVDDDVKLAVAQHRDGRRLAARDSVTIRAAR